MADVLEIIRKLKEELWKEHGDVLEREFTQEEKHLTYYLSDLLDKKGHSYVKPEGGYGAMYTEKAAQAAFIAGLRVGIREADIKADRIVKDRISSAIHALKGGFE